MLAALVTAEIFAPLLVFVRVGAAIMTLPGYGEPSSRRECGCFWRC